MLNGKSKVSLAVLAALVAPGALSPAQADGMRTFNCVGSRGTVSCTSSYRQGITNPYIIAVPGPRTEQEIAESQQREKLWDARCKPVMRQDSFGVERYSYAAAGCEFGKYH